MFGIVANVISDKALRTGAKVFLVSGIQAADSVEVQGLNKSGRRITKYIACKRLTNFRAAWIPEHMRSAPNSYWGIGCWWERKTDAQDAADKLNRMWKGVRFFHRDGRLLQDGITLGAAFKRAKEDPGYGFSYRCIPMDFMWAGFKTHQRYVP